MRKLLNISIISLSNFRLFYCKLIPKIIFFLVATLFIFFPHYVDADTTVSGVIATDTTWDLAGSPYIINDNITVLNGITLTIEPGVMVRFKSGQSILIYGTLNATGAAGNNITFTRDGSAKWDHLRFEAGSTGNLEYCTIEYATYDITNPRGAVWVTSGTADVNLDHCTIQNNLIGICFQSCTSPSIGSSNVIQNNSLAGIYYSECSSLGTIQNLTVIGNGGYGAFWFSNSGDFTIGSGNTITGNSYPLTISYNSFPNPDSVIPATGNTYNDIQVTGFISGTGTWPAFSGVDYIINEDYHKRVEVHGTLTIEPGVTVRFKKSQGLMVYGTLNATGAAGNNITFTRDGSAKWDHLRFEAGSTGNLEYCTIEYATYDITNPRGAVWVTSGTADVNLDHCTIQNNLIGICFEGTNASNIQIVDCSMINNSQYGVYNSGTSTIIAENNWWGDASGPYHVNCNPTGLGDQVSDYIDFEPWLTSPAWEWSFVFITDPHIGRFENEKFSEHESPGWNIEETGSDDYQSVANLKTTLKYVNAMTPKPKFVVFGGDLTDSGELSEFMKFKEVVEEELDDDIPWIPIPGNHDLLPYSTLTNCANITFVGQLYSVMFSQKYIDLYQQIGENFSKQPVWDEVGYLHNFSFDFMGYHFIFLDFNSRAENEFNGWLLTEDDQLIWCPECRYGSAIEGELHNYEYGTWPWLIEDIELFKERKGAGKEDIIIFSHHPFNDRKEHAFWDLCFDFDELEQIKEDLEPFADRIWGQFAGHTHREENDVNEFISLYPTPEIMKVIETHANCDVPTVRIVNFKDGSIVPINQDEDGLVELPKEWPPKSALVIKGLCPIDLIISDPDGRQIGKDILDIPGAFYRCYDTNGDGYDDNIVYIPEAITGNYQIAVVPKPDANPTDTYTIQVIKNYETIFFLENIPISEIPDEPYVFTIEPEESSPLDGEIAVGGVVDPTNMFVKLTSWIILTAVFLVCLVLIIINYRHIQS